MNRKLGKTRYNSVKLGTPKAKDWTEVGKTQWKSNGRTKRKTKFQISKKKQLLFSKKKKEKRKNKETISAVIRGLPGVAVAVGRPITRRLARSASVFLLFVCLFFSFFFIRPAFWFLPALNPHTHNDTHLTASPECFHRRGPQEKAWTPSAAPPVRAPPPLQRPFESPAFLLNFLLLFFDSYLSFITNPSQHSFSCLPILIRVVPSFFLTDLRFLFKWASFSMYRVLPSFTEFFPWESILFLCSIDIGQLLHWTVRWSERLWVFDVDVT